jgi:DNA polymerase-3 subunit delta'
MNQHTTSCNLNTPLPWQHTIWNLLLHRQQNNTLPQALLLVGNKGIGKKIFAKAFAEQLLCLVSCCHPKERTTAVIRNQSLPLPSPTCGRGVGGEGLSALNVNHLGESNLCRACQLFKAQTHPDFMPILPEGLSQTIKIEQIRALNAFVFQTSHFDGYRVVLMESADRMNQSAANALLKTLEEPPAQIIFILITDNVHSIPATIRSRCEKILFPQPDNITVKTWLTSELKNSKDSSESLEPNTIEILIRLAQGNPLEAKRLFETDNLSWRNHIIQDFANILLGNINPFELSEKYKPLTLNVLLFWLKTIATDLIRYKANAPERITHIDKQNLLSQMVSLITTADLFSYLTKLDALDRKIISGFNLNHALVVDDVFCIRA